MPNKIKVSETKQISSVKKGNFNLGVRDDGIYGPTKTGYVIPAVNVDSTATLWWMGINPVGGGYMVYTLFTDSFTAVSAADDSSLVTHIHMTYGPTGITAGSSVSQVLQWAQGQTAMFIANKEYPSIVTDGLVAVYDSDFTVSYPKGSTTTVLDIGGSGTTGTLTNGAVYGATSFGGIFTLDGTNDFISQPGTWDFYGGTQGGDFTWQIWHRYLGGTGVLYGLFWSEAGGNKNILTAYSNLDLETTWFRVDTNLASYSSAVTGTRYNGFGSTAGPIIGDWLLTTVIKRGTSGSAADKPVFNLYWNNGVLMWDSGETQFWTVPAPTQNIVVGARNDGQYASNMQVGAYYIYNRALTPTEIANNYNQTYSRYFP